MKDIKLVVFDIAGTTVKDHGEIATAFHDAMKESGYDIPHEKIYPLMGYKKPEAIRMMLEEYESDVAAITTAYINAIHDRFIALMVAYYRSTDQLQALPHAEEVFAWLKKHDIRIGLDTGFSTDITSIIIERLGWLKDNKIDYVVCSNEVAAGRPQPYMIQKMMKAAGIADAKQVIKIGDTEVDINEGKNAGCLYTIGITTGAFTRAALQPYDPDFIIDDLIELIEIIQ
ncbi:HAD-IA family hydrolase [Panacibacter sp. DH6]|uniref:HAD-IA family hydrolase n=1 Tax=Panacibacter microcysteis TaxID=2793269 RepID=A0A931MDK2_9BACT|nr:HAD-IA family hydrolase [Panacibacter microcysteis]MBG9378726.1 HAD-IA family hydrolase [Panacibacter microcysteis]